MNTLQSLFKAQPNFNQMLSKMNPEQKNIIFEFMGMSEEKRAEKIAEILNQRGITKEQLENIIKNFKK